MTSPVVSVVLPMRDALRTLPEAVDSVLAERDVALELVCVDDGSSDDGPRFVTERARDDARLRLVASRGRGIVAALETGIALTHGRYVGRMDADDISVPGRFASSVAHLDAHPGVAVVGTRVRVLLDDPADEAHGVERHVAWMNALLTPEDHARDRFVDSPLCHPSTTMRREALIEVGGYREGPFAEDYDLWLRLVHAGHGLAKLPETMLAWRHRRDRLTFTDPRCSHEAFRAVKAEHLQAMLKHDPRARYVWGAGRDGHRLARALVRVGETLSGFVDIDPAKIGRTKLGAPIIRETDLPPPRDAFVIVCVGTAGARALIREKLTRLGFVELRDFVCAA